MEKIVVMGASSFTGLNILEHLVREMLYEITAIIRPCSMKKKAIETLSSKIVIVECELEEYVSLYRKIPDCDKLIVLTWAGTRKDERNSQDIHKICRELLDQSIYNILKYTSCNCVISTGSVAEYGVIQKKTEESICHPISEYGINKLAYFNYMMKVCKEFDVRFIHLRILSICGEQDYDYKMFNSVIKNLYENKKVIMESSCTQSWDFVYIEDFVCLILNILKNFNRLENGCYNVSSNDRKTLREYLERIEVIMKKQDMIEFGTGDLAAKKGSFDAAGFDSQKIRQALNWENKVPFDEIVRRMITYLEKHDKNTEI